MGKFKYIVIILVVIAVAVLGTPFFVGMYAEKKIRQLAEHSTANSPLVLNVADYQRGWFSSTYTINLQFNPSMLTNLNDPTAAKELQNFVFSSKGMVHHGPVIFYTDNNTKKVTAALAVIDENYQLPSVQDPQAKKIWNNFLDKISSVSIMHFNGDLQSNVNIPKFFFQSADKKTTIGLGDFSLRLHMSGSLSDMQMTSILNKLDVNIDGVGVKLGNMNLQQDTHKNTSGLWMGAGGVDFSDISVNQNGTNVVNIDMVKMTVATTDTNKLIGQKSTWDVSKMTVMGEKYGPFHLQYDIGNFPEDAINQLQKIQEDAWKANASSNPQELARQQMQTQQQLMHVLPALFSKGAYFNINDFSGNTPFGNFKVLAKASLPEFDPSNFRPDILMTGAKVELNMDLSDTMTKFMLQEVFQDYIDRQQVRAQATGDNSAVPEKDANTLAQEQVNAWLKTGFIVPMEGGYRINVEYNNGQFTINNTVFTPDMLAPVIVPPKSANLMAPMAPMTAPAES